MKRRISMYCLAGVFGFAVIPGVVAAAPHELRLSLHDGKLHTPDLAAAVCREMHLPTFNISGGDINLNSWKGSLCIQSFNHAMGEGCRVRLDKNLLIVNVDPAKLPRHVDDAKFAVRIFTADIAPEAAAHQAERWGIFLPDAFDDRRPLVLLVHGLDSEKDDLAGLGQLLAGDGFQVGYFGYPEDQPIDESGRFFANQMKSLRQKFPAIKVDIVAHSMGGLVARSYVEGNTYDGGIDRLIMVGTPNEGSTWAVGQMALKFNQEYHDWKHNPQWRWTWAITDGLGEAGRDLKPHSKFLEQLNAHTRRAGVRYTIVAGNKSIASRISADVADATVNAVPKKAAKWWGVRQCSAAITRCGDHFRHKTGNGDGPVPLSNIKLAGVDDVVIVPGDHATLICFDHGNPPVAWPAIRERLAK